MAKTSIANPKGFTKRFVLIIPLKKNKITLNPSLKMAIDKEKQLD